MQRRIHIILFLLCTLYGACQKPETRILACEKKYGTQIGKKHFLAAEFVTEEGKLDYHSLNKHNRKNKKNLPDPDCIPIQETPSTEERIYDSETDLAR